MSSSALDAHPYRLLTRATATFSKLLPEPQVDGRAWVVP